MNSGAESVSSSIEEEATDGTVLLTSKGSVDAHAVVDMDQEQPVYC
jgi:hypothetical protein